MIFFKKDGLAITVTKPDSDNEIELNIEGMHAMDCKSIWLTIDEAKVLIAYLSECVKYAETK